MEKFDEKGNVICQICGKTFIKLPPFHLVTHDVTMDQYRETYPDAPIIGKNYKQKPRGKNKEKPVVLTNLLQDIKEAEQAKAEPKIIEGDTIFDDIEHIPKIEELPTPKAEDVDPKFSQVTVREQERIPDGKYEIYVLLKSYFPDIKINYFIEKVDLEKRLEYRCVTDFSVPREKLVFEFPNSFWHNFELESESLKERRLHLDGWKIIKFTEKNPSLLGVVEVLRKNNIF